LEALNHVGASQLEQVLLFEFFENCRFNLNKLIGYEQRDQGIRVGIDSDVQRDDLVE
jgi:hypothetical protein